MSFSDADEEKLINIVAKYPVIYDAGHADYRNIIAKENVWKTIAKELSKSCEDCKKKWKFIRDSYQRFKKKNKLGTGSAAPKNSKDKRHQQLLFLDGVSEHRAGGSNIPTSPPETTANTDNITEYDVDEEEQEDNLENDHEIIDNNTEKAPNEQSIQKPKEKRPRRSNNDEVVKLWKERDEKRQHLLNSLVKRKDDDVELFSRHIAEVLRSLPPIYKAEAKKHLSVVLSNYEIMAARKGSNAGSTYADSRDINIPSTRSSSSLSQCTSYDFNTSYTSPSSVGAYESPGPSNTTEHGCFSYTPGSVPYPTNVSPVTAVSLEPTDFSF